MSFSKVLTTEEVLKNQGISQDLLEFGSPVTPENVASTIEQNNKFFQYDAGNSWHDNNATTNAFQPVPKSYPNPAAQAPSLRATNPEAVRALSVVSTPQPTLEDQLQGMSPEQLQVFIQKSHETLLTKVYGAEIPEMLKAIDILAKSPATSMLIIRKINNQLHKSLFNLITDLSAGIQGITKLTYGNAAGEVFELPLAVKPAEAPARVPNIAVEPDPAPFADKLQDPGDEDEGGDFDEDFGDDEGGDEEFTSAPI